jgi:hypothetical protein
VFDFGTQHCPFDGRSGLEKAIDVKSTRSSATRRQTTDESPAVARKVRTKAPRKRAPRKEDRLNDAANPSVSLPATSARTGETAESKGLARDGELIVRSDLVSPSTVLPWERELLLGFAPQLLEAILGDGHEDDEGTGRKK